MEPSPYRGLLRFEPEDADMFFGRERLVADLLARLPAARLLTVVGGSGSGKSSVVRAGLVAGLRRGALPGSERWPVILLTPGRQPTKTLAACLAAATGAPENTLLDDLVARFRRAGPSVLVVDQLEELFTLGTGEQERAGFIEALVRDHAVDQPDNHVVLVIRSDFYEAFTTVPVIAAALPGTQIVVAPQSEAELRRMITLPARAGGVVLEPGLTDEVVADAAGAGGALPLVSTALLEAWRRRTVAMVMIDGYRAAGGVRGAIATLAEDVWAALGSSDQRLARSMLLRLSGTEASSGDVSTPVQRAELADPGDVAAERVLGLLVGRRLVTVDDDTARLAHEALLREWPRMSRWLEEDRATSDVLHHLRRAAADWEREGADTADLYRGTRLVSALDVAREVSLSQRERLFLEASAREQNRDLDALRRRSRRLRALSVSLVMLLLLASIAGVTAIARQREAADQARVAVAQRLARESESVSGLDLRLLLAVEARRLDDSPEARGALLGQLTQADAVTAFLRGGATELSDVAVSPDGTLLAAGGADGSVSVWRLPSRDPVGIVALLDSGVTTLTFSADGELAAGGDNGEVARWRPESQQPSRFVAHAQDLLAIAYRSDDSLVTAGRDGLLRAFALSTGEELWSRSLPSGAVAGTFDQNGSTYAQIGGDAELSVIDVRTGVPLDAGAASANDTATALALSADGRVLAIGDQSGGVHLADLAAGETADLGRIAAQDDDTSLDGVDALAFTLNGDVVATAGGTITRLGPAGDDTAEPLQLTGGRVTGLAVDPEGDAVAVVIETGETVMLALGRPTLGRPLPNAGHPVTALSVGATGSLVAAAGDGQVALLDRVSGDRRVLTVPGNPVAAVALSGDGMLLAAGGGDVFRGGGGPRGTYSVLDVESGRVIVDRDSFANADVTAVALAPGGDVLAIGDERGQVHLLEAMTGDRIHDLLSLGAPVSGLAFTPSGDELVGVSVDGTVARWTARGRPIGDPIELGSAASGLAMTADGRSIAVATALGAVIVDLTTGAAQAPLASPYGRVESVAVGLDGLVLATGGSGRVLLWDVPSGRRLGNPLPAPDNTTVAFDATGRELVTGGDDGEVIVWQVDPDTWETAACELAGRTLTREEWRRYLGDRGYRPACR